LSVNQNYLNKPYQRYLSKHGFFVKSYHYHKEELSNLELLLELQHYGAATGLVDFSRDFLVALWFACDSNKDKESLFID
jgi:hypothetical protein